MIIDRLEDIGSHHCMTPIGIIRLSVINSLSNLNGSQHSISCFDPIFSLSLRSSKRAFLLPDLSPPILQRIRAIEDHCCETRRKKDIGVRLLRKIRMSASVS